MPRNEGISNPQKWEDVVITGMAGLFPDSDNVYNFRDNLFNKVDLVSGDYRRWKPIHPEVPQRTGKINHITNFDPGYFGVPQRQATVMDPMNRLLMEKTFEAIVDAGYSPSELVGSKTGVFIGACFSESEKTHFYTKPLSKGFAILGCTRSMLANRLSYAFQLQGPSYITDTACSSSLFALEHAYKALRNGTCDMAIVGGAGLCLHPIVSLQFARLGVLSADGACKVFDNAANGYARSEAIAVLLLQKSKDARRIYAQVLHAKTNCDGFKQQGITYPSSEMQKVLMSEVYKECGIKPASLTFVEAHGTGTTVGDPEELNSLDDIFCLERDRPLYVGAIKSNIGHNEPVSGICSIVKVLIGLESGFIPPNINFTQIRQGVEALEKNRIKVVTDKMPLPDNNGLVGVNSFGFGGANCHLLLRWNQKTKINNGLPKDNLPRLICVSGRTQEAVDTILGDLENRQLDVEFVKLLHTVFGKEILDHNYRGYSIVTTHGVLKRSLTKIEVTKKKMVLVFGNYDEHWFKIGSRLFSVPVFAATIQKIQNILSKETNINITDIIINFYNENLLNQVLGTVTVQLCLSGILKLLGLAPDSVIGVGTGELVAAHFEGCLTLQETIISSVYVGLTITKLIGYNRKFSNAFDNVLVQNLKKVIQHQIKDYKNWVPLYHDKSIEFYRQGSAEYFVQNILSDIDLATVKNIIPNEFFTLLIGARSDVIEPAINLVDGLDNSITIFLQNLGSLYEHGFNINLDRLYPNVQWPVSRGTPMISPLIKWDYKRDWFVAFYQNEDEIKSGQRVTHVVTKEDDWNFVTGHVIDGRNLFPATGYLVLVWETLARMIGKLTSDMKVVFEDVKFLRATNIPKQGEVELIIIVQTGDKRFEVIESGAAVVIGKIYEMDFTNQEIAELPIPVDNSDAPSLKQKDIYKELRLRGYQYKGQFRGLRECNSDTTKGLIVWNKNWITFMDNMLQMEILQGDTKNLYVPTSIQQVIVDGQRHTELACQSGDDNERTVPVYVYKDSGIIKSGGIEIRGVSANSIPRKKNEVPVLETYKFISNQAILPLDQSVRIMMQIILENSMTVKVKSMEVANVDDQNDMKLISPFIQQALGDMPLIQPEIIVLSKQQLDLPGIIIENKKIAPESDCLLMVGSNLLQNNEMLNTALTVTKAANGYIISRENKNLDISKLVTDDIEILCVHTNDIEKVVLMSKPTAYINPIIIDVSNSLEDLNWLPVLQNAIKSNLNTIVFSQNCHLNGLLGLVNCLRRETNGSKIRGFFIIDSAPKFDFEHEFYQKQLRKNLSINVWKDAKWGTYRHLLMNESPKVESEHCYVNVTVRGDLSSMRWIEGPLRRNMFVEPEKELVDIYCSSLNFRDVMTASGRISVDVVITNRLDQECVQGFEFSGRDSSGRRVMGMVTSGALSTIVMADSHMLYPIPEHWSMEDAATVPVVYGTVIYALIMRGRIKYGQSILIHSATGGVGQAAINIALYFGCKIFVTVGTKEKKTFLRQTYPQIQERHIGNSRDTSFEQMIYKETKGRGVDMILNSLAEDKLLASFRCLAHGGKFLEIGKFDMANDNPLAIEVFARQASFDGVMLDTLFLGGPTLKHELSSSLLALIDDGAVKPLPRTIFKEKEIEQAFRFMATGKHMGKVLVRIRKEEKERVCAVPYRLFKGIPRFFCNPEYIYIILGGLGGFGLQLADWFALRGARKLILTSRSGVKTGYQAMMIRLWKSYGTKVTVRTDDISTEKGCAELLQYANSMGLVEGIFNLAVVLKDALLENQTIDDYKISLAPKAYATKHLDVISRKLCPHLKYFVIFSSVSCGRGNIGQSNYGMANSVMERICEKRKTEGYPALAIQWGAIGDVGLVAEMQEEHIEIVIGGTLQQKISSCLQVLDNFLRQYDPIVGSMVVAEKRSNASGANNIVDAVVNIIGIGDIKTVSLHSSFPELGMDSMMAVEIKQTLEREYEVFLTPQDIRTMTLVKLQNIANEKMANKTTNLTALKAEELPTDIKLLLNHMGDENTANTPVVHLKNIVSQHQGAPTVYTLPGIEGMSVIFEPLAKNVNANVCCLQFCAESAVESIENWAELLLSNMNLESNTFNIVAYSFGCVVATELVHMLEKTGSYGKVVFIDGAPDLMLQMTKTHLQIDSEEIFQTSLLCCLMTRYLSFETILKYKGDILKCKSYEDRIKIGLNISPNLQHSPKYITDMCIQAYQRLKAVLQYRPKFNKLKSKIVLFKPKECSVIDIPADYKLSEYFQGPVDVKTFEGNHVTIMENPEIAQELNKLLGTDLYIKIPLADQVDVNIANEIKQI